MALRLLGRGAVQAAPLITDRIPLDGGGERRPEPCCGTNRRST